MKPFLCIAIAITAMANTGFAGPGKPSTLIFRKTFAAQLKDVRFLFEAPAAKRCACQVLRVKSRNEQETVIAVFAQGNDTSNATGFATAAAVLDKEKKHLKDFFFTSVELTENLTAASSCSMLYKNILARYDGIKPYDVLDADALSNKQVFKK